MPTQTDIELNDRALVIQNAVEEKENTALRVGSLLVDMIYNHINKDSLDTDVTLAADSDIKLATQKAVKAYVDAMVSGSQTVPPGTVDLFAGPAASIPAGWMLCDGAAISRATYVNLFNVIGTDYGTGDGSTTFNLPNVGKKFVAGLDAGDAAYDTPGKIGGANTKILTVGNLPAHTHYVASQVTAPGLNVAFTSFDSVARDNEGEGTNRAYRLDPAANLADIGQSSSVGTADPVDIQNEFVVMPYKIKY